MENRKQNKRIIRVLILTANLNIGGQQKYTLRQVRTTDRNRYRITVGYVEDGPLRSEYEALSVPLFRYSDSLNIYQRVWNKRIPLVYPTRLISPVQRVVRFVRQNNIDIIQTNGVSSYVVGSTASWLTGVPSIRIQGNIMKEIEKIHYKFFRYLPFYHWTDKYVTFSKCSKADLQAGGVSEEHIYYIEAYGVNLDEFHPNISGMTVRRELEIAPNVPVVGQAGRLVENKRFDFMLRGARLVIDQMPGTIFLVVGDGPEREQLEQLVQSLGIQHNVIFTGMRLDMPQVVAAFDISVFTMEYTVGGTANFESMATGKPVVCTHGRPNLQSSPIVHGKTGFVVPSDDIRTFAEAIITLIRDRVLRQKMGKKARQVSEERYDFVKMVTPKMQQLYDELAGDSNA